MAVAVDEAPYVVLDDDFRIVEADWAADDGAETARGRSPLDYFPGARPLFLPYLREAKRTGRVVELTQYFDGYVVDVRIVPRGTTLVVSWKRLCMLDVLTLEGLRASLQQVLDTLAAREETARRRETRELLRVVEGGA